MAKKITDSVKDFVGEGVGETVTESVVRIPLDEIVPDPRNRRHGGRSPEELAGLAESIKTHGVQEPAIVRIHSGAEATYVLVAGERRFLASRLAGLDYLPCIVREMTDSQALAVQLIENLHRQDIHPLDEAEGYERLRDEAGYTAELIAQEVGRSPAYVYQRLRLQKLIPEVRALLEAGTISTAVAVVCARLPEAQQKLVRASQLAEYNAKHATAESIERWIKDHILCDLKKIAWKLTDATLVKKAGACSECPKRTGIDPGLFEDGGAQKCLDPACYRAKTKAIIKRNTDSLEGQEHLKVSSYWYGAQGKDVLQKQDWVEVKKTEPGALRAVVVDGNKPGRLVWAKKVDRAARSAIQYMGGGSRDPEAEAARDKRLEAKKETNRRLFRLVMEACASDEFKVNLLRQFAKEDLYHCRISSLAEWHGWTPKEGIDEEREALKASAFDAIDAMGTDLLLALILSIRIGSALAAEYWGSPICDDLEPYLELYRIDGEAVRAEVYAAAGVPLEDPDDDDDDEEEDDEEEEYDPGNDDTLEGEGEEGQEENEE